MKRFTLAMAVLFGVVAVGCDSNPEGPAAPSAPSAPSGDASATTSAPAPKSLTKSGGRKKTTSGAEPVGVK